MQKSRGTEILSFWVCHNMSTLKHCGIIIRSIVLTKFLFFPKNSVSASGTVYLLSSLLSFPVQLGESACCVETSPAPLLQNQGWVFWLKPWIYWLSNHVVSSDWCHRTQQSRFSIRVQNAFVWLSSETYGVSSITPWGSHIIMVPLIEDHMSSAKLVPANILDIKAKQTCKKYRTLPTDLQKNRVIVL